jgi:uncharacterized protein
MIDTNVNLFRWPFRRVMGDDPRSLVMQLRAKGVTEAWASSFEGLLFRDVAGVNARLAQACREHGPNFLVPFGCVNPKPDWEEDLRRCHEIHRMPGIRLFPNYHGYKLSDPAFLRLVSVAAERGLLVQIALSMEDPRTQFPLMLVPPVNPAPLATQIHRVPKLRVLLLNAAGSMESGIGRFPALAHSKNVYFDIAMVDGVVGGLPRLLAGTSPSRVVFGSHYPFFYFESALLKVREAGLTAQQASALYEGNARALMAHR